MNYFNHAALRSEIEQVRKEALLPIMWQKFKRIDPGSEVFIQFGRGARENFRDAIHFWLTVLIYWSHAANFPDVEIFFANTLDDKYTLCREIAFEKFREIVQWYNFVESEHDFSPHGKFRQAWLVFDVGTEIAILAETDEEFAVFSWELDD